MTDNNKYLKLFNELGHLNDEGIAYYSEALMRNEIQFLPNIILSHVMECSECKMNCLEVTEILEIQQSSESGPYENKMDGKPWMVEEPKAVFNKPAKSKILVEVVKIAAVFIIVAGVGWMITNWMRNMKDENVKITQTVDPKEIKTGIEYWVTKWSKANPAAAQSYQLNSKLEAMLKLVFRSTDFQVKEPDSIAEFKTGIPITFNWIDKRGKELKMRIVDSKGNIVHQRLLKHHTAYEINKKLEPGLYYWFIEQANFSVAAGRFGVIQDQ